MVVEKPYLCDGQDLTLITLNETDPGPPPVYDPASAASTNIWDMGAAATPHQSRALDFYKHTGDSLPGILAWLTEACTDTGATGATLTVDLQCDNDSEFGSAQTLWTSGAIPTATLVAYYRFLIDELPAHMVAIARDSRYFRLYFTVAGEPFLTGKISAGFIAKRQTNQT